MNVLKKIGRNLEEYIVVFCIAALAAVVFVQVVARGLGTSLIWSEELARYLLVAVTFIGASLGVKRKAHTGIAIVTDRLPETYQKGVKIFAVGLCVSFCLIVSFYALQIMITQQFYGQRSPAMQIPMWIPYFSIPFGMILMAIRFIQSLFITDFYKTKEEKIEEGDQWE